jgi:hypothetical protein
VSLHSLFTPRYAASIGFGRASYLGTVQRMQSRDSGHPLPLLPVRRGRKRRLRLVQVQARAGTHLMAHA